MSQPRKPPMPTSASYAQQSAQSVQGGQGRNVGSDGQKHPRRPPIRGALNQGGAPQGGQQGRGGVSGVTGVPVSGVAPAQANVAQNVYSAQVGAAPQAMMQPATANTVQAAQIAQAQAQAQGSQAQPVYLVAQTPGVMMGNFPVGQVILQPPNAQMSDLGQQARPQRAPMKMQFVNMPMQGNQQGQPIFVMQQPMQPAQQQGAQLNDAQSGAAQVQAQVQASGQVADQSAQVAAQGTTQAQGGVAVAAVGGTASNVAVASEAQPQQAAAQVAAQAQGQQAAQQSKPPQTSGAAQVNGQQTGPSKPAVVGQGGSPKKPISQSPDRPKSGQKKGGRQQRTQPPWFEFTGPGKANPDEQGWADRVRQVISGDTLKLALPRAPNKRNQPAQLKTIILDGIRTPKLQRWSGADEDAYGFEARECVRKLVLNKRVYYCVWKTNPTNPEARTPGNTRLFGDVYVMDNNGKRVSVTQYVVQNGYGDIVEKKPGNATQQEYDALKNLQDKAKKGKKGKWCGEKSEKHVRSLNFVTEGRDKIAQQFMNKSVPAIVDSVLTGSLMRVELMPPETPLTHTMMLVNLAGCRAPRVPRKDGPGSFGAGGSRSPSKQEPKGKGGKKGKDGKDGGNSGSPGRRQRLTKQQLAAEREIELYADIAEFAREWTEERLLGQNVTVTMTQVDKQNNVYAQVVHPMGKIAVSLLKQGLAEYEDWTAPKQAAERNLLKSAQKEAQGNLSRIWKKKGVGQIGRETMGTVVQVVSGDTLIVRITDPVLEEDVEERFTLSSIIAPRLGARGKRDPNRSEEQKKADEDQPYAREAKEFLRKMTIGQQVSVIVEYTREPRQNDNNAQGPGGKNNNNNNNNNQNRGGAGGRGGRGGKGNKNPPPKQAFATMYIGPVSANVNVAVELVRNGLATVVAHPSGQKRSCAYEALMHAEKYATGKKVGCFEDRFMQNRDGRRQFMRDMGGRTVPPPKDYSLEPVTGGDVFAGLKSRLMSQKDHEAVVEFIFSPNRLKLYLPKLNFYIPVTLAGIRCEPFSLKKLLTFQQEEDAWRESQRALLSKKGGNKDGGKPRPTPKIAEGDHTEWGTRAYNYLRDTVLQRNVKVTILDVRQGDYARNQKGRGGKGNKQRQNQNPARSNTIFMGNIVFGDRNIAENLLEDGLASVMPFYKQDPLQYSRYSRNRAQPIANAKFDQLQEQAQTNNVGMWPSKKEQQVEYKMSEEPSKTRTGEELKVIVSHIESGTMFYVNEAESQALEEMELAMSKLEAKAPSGKIKPNKYVAALYDGLYGRARIHKRDLRDGRENSWFVMFIDYGNRASISEKQMAALPDALRPPQGSANVDGKIAPLAIKCQLAGLRAPSTRGGNYTFREAGHKFCELAMSLNPNDHKVLTMRILHDDWRQVRWLVELYTDKEKKHSINADMVSCGLARLSKPGIFVELDTTTDPQTKAYLERMKKLKDEAAAQHLGMHKFGEYDSDDDDAY